MELFADSRKRIDRAAAHANAFKSIWEATLDPKSYSTAIEMNGDWTEGVAKFIHAPIPENNLALELGEMFYQLRAALDAALYEASVIAHRSDPPPNETRIEFPIYSDPDRFEKSPVYKSPFPKEIRDWMETIQPYNNAKAVGPDALLICALELLHDCARKDRHRKLHIVAAVPTSFDYKLNLSHGRLTSWQPLEANLLEGKDEFLRFTVEGFSEGDGAKIKLDSEVRVDIAVDEIPLVDPGNTGAALDAIFVAADLVIGKFEDWHK